MKTDCNLCPHHCSLEEGQTGLCRARANKGGEITCTNYGRITSLALDPVEKKPLRRFYPGRWILSVGSYGCNLRCPFCQNCEISMKGDDSGTAFISPEELVEQAVELAGEPRGNIGVAFTYNEPLISFEYVRDCAELLQKAGLKTVLVTNGYICEEPLQKLLPFVDAMNIDLKGFTPQYYEWLGGDLETVKHTVELSVKKCHVEVTTLVVPGKNDFVDEMEDESSWLASLSPEIPLHISRFFPRFHMEDTSSTPVETVYGLCRTAQKYLKYVYAGNC